MGTGVPTIKQLKIVQVKGLILCCCAVSMLLTALVQPHWVTTDVWHELEPQWILSSLHPCVSALALVSAGSDLPSIRAAGAGARPGQRARGPGPSQRSEAAWRPEAGLRLRRKMSSQLDTSWGQAARLVMGDRGEVRILTSREFHLSFWMMDDCAPDDDPTGGSRLPVLQHWFIPVYRGCGWRSHGPSS